MPGFARWRRSFSLFALTGATIAAASVFFDTGGDDTFKLSPWLGGGLFFLFTALAALARNRVRMAFWLACPTTLIGLAGVVACLLAYNGFSRSLSGYGFRLMNAMDAHVAGCLALLLASAATLMACTTRRHGFGREALAASGIVVAMLVVSVLVGQRFHFIPLEAGVLAHKLLSAESAMLLLAAALLVIASALFRSSGFDVRNRFLPALAFAVLLAASFHLWLVLVGQEQLAVRRQALTTAERLSSSMTDHFKERVNALDRMSSRMATGESLRREPWLTDVRNYLDDFASMSAIGWVAPDGRVKWAASRDSDEYHVGEQYASEARRRDVLDEALASGQLAFSEPLPLRAGGFGHVVALPLVNGDGFEGWLVVGVRFVELFSADVGSVAPGFAVRVIEDGQVIYSRINDERRHPLAPVAKATVTAGGLQWVIEIWPESAFFANLFLWLPGLMLALGVLASLMFAIALYQLEADRRRTESLRESEERYRLTAQQTGELVYDYHLPSGRVDWLGAIEEITGEKPDAFANVDIDGWIARLHPDDALYVLPLLQSAERAMDRFVAEYRFMRNDGRYVRVEERGVFLAGNDGRPQRMLGTIADVTERYEFEQQLRQLAHFDQQTALRNRVWFMEDAVGRAEVAERERTSFWCVFLDIDRFRAVNETLGHVVGDVLLEAVARRLETLIGDRGALARVGGDEFGVCISATDADRGSMTAFCEELMREFSRPLDAAGHSLFVTLSVGVAIFPADGGDIQEVIRAAETAMFRAKQRGRNTYAFYETHMSAGARENLEIANALRRALDREEFHLVFQPRYSLSTGRVTGMEALLRWNSAELGVVPPGVFIPIAEETGLIGPIGWHVVDAAAAAACRIGEEGMLARRMAINVSARQLIHAGFVAELVRRVEVAGAKPHWFEIELTESLMMEDPERARELFVKLHEHGFTVSIDDFGTGYSSLNYLTHFPADCLKVDRSFVQGLPDDEDLGAIVRTIVSLGQGLGMKIVAEGIETEAQSRFLRDAGCQEAQGFLFAKPMRLEELARIISDE